MHTHLNRHFQIDLLDLDFIMKESCWTITENNQLQLLRSLHNILPMCLYMYYQIWDKRKIHQNPKLHECINKIMKHRNDLLTCIAQTCFLSRLSEHNPSYNIKLFDIFGIDTTHFKLSILKGTALYHKGIYTVVKSVQRSISAWQPFIMLTYAFFV